MAFNLDRPPIVDQGQALDILGAPMKTPSILTPHRIFEENARYKAPVFQRLYEWGKQEFETLQEDIDNADQEIGQFLGAIVLKDLGKSEGPSSPTSYLMIDGQQRLTTIYLLLVALAKVAEDHEDYSNADFLWQTYLAENRSPRYKGWPKLIPTLQDRHTFWEILQSALGRMAWDFKEDPPDKKPRDARKLKAQWNLAQKYVESRILDEAGEFNAAEFNRILKTIQQDLRCICIVLEEKDDANAIFSRLNAKGIPLDLADLVRNEVFSKFGVAQGEEANRFYLRQWHPFERTFPPGSLSAFFPIYSYVIFKGKVTKAAAFGELQKEWRTSTPEKILSALKKYSPFYCALTSYSEIEGLGSRINLQLKRFSQMPRSRVTWPFIVQVLSAILDGTLEEEEGSRSLKMVEAFLVRRALVGREPTGLHAVFKTLWDRTKGDPALVKEKIVSRTIQVPTDSEVRKALREKMDDRVIMPFVLGEVEFDFVERNGFDHTNEIPATLEHILPRNPKRPGAWAKAFTRNDHKRLVGVIGNLVPLSGKQNKSLQDESWEKKRKRFKGSAFKTTAELAGFDEWNAESIRRRNEEMTRSVLTLWPGLDSVLTSKL